MSQSKSIYKVIFINQNSIYEIYARQVVQSNLLGFIEAEELIFGERSSVVVDPAEERLKSEFNSVKRSYIPLHTILRIDEVIKEGTSKIRDFTNKSTNVSTFPSQIYTPPKDKS
jgi:hypothetical protein